jgi:hypothetical protein
MAQTKTSPKKAKPKTRSSGRAKPGASSKSKASANGKPKRARPASKSATSKPRAVVETVEETAKDAGGAVSRAAGKAKVPLMAGGAALAGAAGGLALGARQAHRKGGLGSVSSKDLAKAARKAGDVGVQIGEVALEVRRARESSNGHTRRSPVEVVLQGLTSRQPR